MRYIYISIYTVLNLECWKCARTRQHCVNCLVVLRMRSLEGALLYIYIYIYRITYIYIYRILNLECWKCARTRQHCADCLSVLRICQVAHLRGNTAVNVSWIFAVHLLRVRWNKSELRRSIQQACLLIFLFNIFINIFISRTIRYQIRKCHSW